MPFNLDLYPYLKEILNKVYANHLVVKGTVDGTHDSNWIKEYELFYEKQPNAVPYVMRVLFKVNKKRGEKAGFSNIRPITDGSEVSETFMIPPKDFSTDKEVYIKCLDVYDVYGERVECVPYIMPETIFGMCIHASIWICLKILERRGRMIDKALCIPEIQRLAKGSPYSDKEGLKFVQTARLLRMCRANAFYVINKEPPQLTDDQMLMELYAYVESRLPVIVGVDVADLQWWNTNTHGYHSIVAIGHTMEKNKINGFVFHDESALPYQMMTKDELLMGWHVPHRTVREMLVAVPPEVSLPFHEVYHQFEELILVLHQKNAISQNIQNLVIRPMIRSSAEFFIEVRLGTLLRALRESDWPPYIWVFYLYERDVDRKDAKNIKGFFVRDATARTDLRFFYFREEERAIYQVKGDQVYSIHEGQTRRKKL